MCTQADNTGVETLAFFEENENTVILQRECAGDKQKNLERLLERCAQVQKEIAEGVRDGWK